MLNIPAEEINLHAPYQVTSGEANSFYFTTIEGVEYNVGFAEDFMLADEGVYQFYIVNLNHVHSANDPNVRITIECIIKAFFAQEPAVMLYICDGLDHRQKVRDRLFRLWFDEYAQHNDFTFVSGHVVLSDIDYYSSILLRKNHPLHDQLVERFETFIQELPAKLDQLSEQ